MTAKEKLEERNGEDVIQEFMSEGHSREQAIKNLESIDRAMADIATGRVHKIQPDEL